MPSEPDTASSLTRREVADALRAACRAARSDAAAARADVSALAERLGRDPLPAGDDKLSIADRTAVRLLEAGFPWTALDVVTHDLDKQPFATDIRGERVFVWLPGFDDPRVGAPLDLYDISDRIVLRSGVDEIRRSGDELLVGGFAHLSHLAAGRDDAVTLVLAARNGDSDSDSDSDSDAQRVRAERVRRADRGTESGERLTRLAWSGFCAVLPVELLAPGTTYDLRVQVAQGSLARSGELVPTAAAGLAAALDFTLPADDGGAAADIAVSAAPALRVQRGSAAPALA